MTLKTGKNAYYKSLAASLTFSFSALIMIALLVACSLQMYVNYNTQKELLIANQELIAKNTANTVTNTIREKYNLLSAASKHKDLTELQENEITLTLERLMGIEPAFRQITIFNMHKEEMTRVSRLSRSLSSRTMVYDHNDLFTMTGNREIYIGPVYIDEITRVPMMAIGVPVTNIFNDYRGTLLAEVNLKFLWDLMYQIRIGVSGQAYIIEKEGYLIAYRDIDPVLKREKLTHLKVVQNFINNGFESDEAHTEISTGILGVKAITTHVNLPALNWAVIVELPITEAYRPLFLSLVFSGAAMLFSIILAIASGIFLSRRITRPLIELRDAAKKIGMGQLSLEIDIRGNNEISDLAGSFNTMVKDLKNTTVSRDLLLKEIQERVNAEQNLAVSEQKMSAILMASPIGIGLVYNGRLKWVNDSVLSLTGYGREFLLEHDVTILFVNEEEYKKVRGKILSGSQCSGPVNVETKLVRKDGTLIDCMLSACPLDSSDLEKGRIVTLTDISESKQLQEKLLRSQKLEAIGTLSAGVAHDLNNILGAIVGYPEMLLMEMTGDNPMRGSLSKIKKAGERAAAIVKDLLTMARRGVAIDEVVNLNDIIDEFLKGPEFENILVFHPHAHVKTDLSNNIHNIMGSNVKLAKVLMNLISNAAESMPEGGIIEITTQNQELEQPLRGYEPVDKGHYVKLTVSDTGEGISKDNLKKIFEPFFTKKKMGRSGTGLGMTVVWGTVKDHNGYIDVESEEGKGSTFSLYFPVSCKKIEVKTPSPSADSFRSRGEFILIVDDVKEQRLMLSEILEKLGYRVKALASGEEAVTWMENNSADLVVLDMIMDPGINGYETYKRILEIHKDQKAIIVSGFSETSYVKETLNLGAKEYIQKPYSVQEIGRKIREVLDS